MAFNSLREPASLNRTNRLRHMLRKRSASVPSDEALCLFNLAGMDLSVVGSMSGEGQLRMKAFWDRIEEIPSGFLFSKSPKKLESAGHRWAPSSFMGKPYPAADWSGDGFISQTLMGIPTKKGFVCRLSAFVLEFDVSKIAVYGSQKGFFFRSGTCWYDAYMHEPWHQKPCSPPDTGKQKMVLLLMQPIWEKLYKRKTEGTNWNLTTRALLAFIVNGAEAQADYEKENAIHIKCWQHFLVRFDPADQPVNNIAWDAVTALSPETIRPESLPHTATSLASQLVESDWVFKRQCDVWAAGTDYANGEARLSARILQLALPMDEFAGEADTLREQLWCAD